MRRRLSELSLIDLLIAPPPREGRQLSGAAWGVVIACPTVILALTAMNFIAAYATKTGCSTGVVAPTRMSCYSDIESLWRSRHLSAHIFPYVHGEYLRIGNVTLIGNGEIEYPVVTGLFAWLTGLLASTPQAFLEITAFCLAPIALVTAWMLQRIAGYRAVLFALAPEIAMFGLLNWDLLAAATCTAGILMWYQRRNASAAVLFAVGGCAKLWPLFLLLPLVLDTGYREGWRRCIRPVCSSLLTVLVLNAPLAALNLRGWWAPMAFQSSRPVDLSTNSVWYWLTPQFSTAEVNRLSDLAFAAGAFGLIWWSMRRTRRTGSYPFLQVAAALVWWYLITAKTWSPQYALWVLPFFVFLRVRGWLYAAFVGSDIALYVLWFGHTNLGPALGYAVRTRFVVALVLVPASMFASTALVGRSVSPPDESTSVVDTEGPSPAMVPPLGIPRHGVRCRPPAAWCRWEGGFASWMGPLLALAKARRSGAHWKLHGDS